MAASQGQWVMTHQAPDFIIVGAQKAGTTSLYNCLKQHPEIVPASKKEIQYFSQFYNKGYDWYLQHFKLRDDNLQSGEASPFYLFHPHAAARIAQALPEVRIIVLLRNPVQRAISHYHQQARRGHEKLTMFEAFINEERRIAKPWQKLLNNEQVSGVKIQQCSYLKRGLYLEQLLRYEAHFPPAQIHLVDSDVFFTNTVGALQALHRFLGIREDFTPADQWPRKPGNYRDTDPAILDWLQHYFAAPNEALFQHLGRRFDWY